MLNDFFALVLQNYKEHLIIGTIIALFVIKELADIIRGKD